MFLSASQSVGSMPMPTVIDALSDPDGTAYLLSRRAPSPAAVAVAAAIELPDLGVEGCVDLLVALDAQIDWLNSQQQRLLAHMQTLQDKAADPSDPASATWLREEVSCALRLAPGTARVRIDVAVCLAAQLPETLALLTAGQVSYDHARALAEAVAALEPSVVSAVQTRVLGRASTQTVGEFRAAIKLAVLAIDTATAEEKHRRAAEDRGMGSRPVGDEMTELWFLLPTQGAAVVIEAVNCLAAVTSAQDIRTIDQRRADALVSLGSGLLNDPNAPRAQGLRPHIQVTVAATTLLGLDDHPAELDGYGAIPASMAREIAADPTGTWRRIVTDPESGTMLDYGRTRYRPPPSLAKHVMARDRECSFPYCHRRAYRCDIDHVVRWADGGTTSADNLQPLCPRHHRAKDEFLWQARRDPDTGYFHWISPKGRHYTKQVPRYVHTMNDELASAASNTSRGVAGSSGAGESGAGESQHRTAAYDEPAGPTAQHPDSDVPPF